jgi:hypothetical protein
MFYSVSIDFNVYRRFGFPNQEALTAGKSGSDCRGEEHDVTLTWSVASGKRIIMANSRQIYCNTVKSSVFEYSWVTEKNHNIRLCVYSTAPGNGERQYELSVDGISFYKMPKIFEVGLKGTLDDRVPGVITNIDRSKLLENSNIRSGGYDYSISGRTLVPKNEQEVSSHHHAELRQFRKSNSYIYLFQLGARGTKEGYCCLLTRIS